MTIKIAKSRRLAGDVQAFNYEVNGTSTHLEWQPLTDPNLSYYEIRHSTSTTVSSDKPTARYSDATTAVEKVPRPANSVNVPARAGTYMIKAYSKGGKPSADFASVVVPTADITSYSQSLTQAEHTAFSGTKVGLTVASNKIYITDGNTGLTNRYDFSNYIQTHDSTVRLVNVRIDATLERKDLTNGFVDALPQLFDDLPTGIVYSSSFNVNDSTNTGFDSVHSRTNHGDCNLIYQVSMTDDDPAGSPTWSDYKQFRAGQFSGRAFRFRVFFRSSTSGFSPEVRALTAFVEYNT